MYFIIVTANANIYLTCPFYLEMVYLYKFRFDEEDEQNELNNSSKLIYLEKSGNTQTVVHISWTIRALDVQLLSKSVWTKI